MGSGNWTNATSYLECSEVNDTVNVWVLLENIVESFLISNVKVDKVWPLPSYELNAINNFRRRVL